MDKTMDFMKSKIVQDFTKDIRQYNLGPLWEAIPELMHHHSKLCMAWHEHVANEDSYLFSTSDLPMMEKFNVEREEAYESNNGYQEVKDEFKPLLS